MTLEWLKLMIADKLSYYYIPISYATEICFLFTSHGESCIHGSQKQVGCTYRFNNAPEIVFLFTRPAESCINGPPKQVGCTYRFCLNNFNGINVCGL